jgi:hypothetical protein
VGFDGKHSQGDIVNMDEQVKPEAQVRGKDEVALELMKFIANSTGYGKGAQAVGFGGKGSRTPEEQADSLLELFERCRGVVNRDASPQA